MDIQEMDTGFVQIVSLDFYDRIEMRLGDGRQVPLWGKNKDVIADESSDRSVLVFTSENPPTKSDAQNIVDVLRDRLDDGWFFELA
ncbi:hypothetical protein [Pseudomonas sp. GL-B-16]|uniref:hypothetical protein n=1 Tax=Pseudomonas sp. GL-B-16 TaxID=2832373 RepID=UPI001CBD0483|nr:hypothetical protein [Pseudomonas sp. GL-B-16]